MSNSKRASHTGSPSQFWQNQPPPPPARAPPGSSQKSASVNSSARLLSNVEAVAASARPSVSCFQSILEAPAELAHDSTATSGTFSSSSSRSSTRNNSVVFSPAEKRDQSELTFAEDLTYSSWSISQGGDRDSPQSPSPNNKRSDQLSDQLPIPCGTVADAAATTTTTATAVVVSTTAQAAQHAQQAQHARHAQQQRLRAALVPHLHGGLAAVNATAESSITALVATHDGSTEAESMHPTHALTPAPESISLCLPPEPSVEATGERVATGVVLQQPAEPHFNLQGPTSKNSTLVLQQRSFETQEQQQFIHFPQPQQQRSLQAALAAADARCAGMHDVHAHAQWHSVSDAAEEEVGGVRGSIRGGTAAAQKLSAQRSPRQLAVGKEPSLQGILPNSPADAMGPKPDTMMPNCANSGAVDQP